MKYKLKILQDKLDATRTAYDNRREKNQIGDGGRGDGDNERKWLYELTDMNRSPARNQLDVPAMTAPQLS